MLSWINRPAGPALLSRGALCEARTTNVNLATSSAQRSRLYVCVATLQMFTDSSNLKTNKTRIHSFSASVSYVFCNRPEWRTTDRRTDGHLHSTKYHRLTLTNKMHLCYTNILTFNSWCLLRISNPRIHLQEDGCIYSYGTVRFT